MTPSVGGFYFGGLIAGATRAAARAGHRVVASQTFPTRLERERHRWSPLPGGPWSLDAIDGLVIVMDAVPASRLDLVRERGLPIVLVSSDPPGFPAPVVLPDNAGGARAAVEHLLEHGHTRIGFAGDLSQRDIRERFDAYRSTLSDHGIRMEPEWFFAADGNLEQGGQDAAARFLATGMPTTATIAGTDNNAIGFIRTLRASDLSAPHDQAVIAFDHTEIGARLLPRLSTVNPHHDHVGELAVAQLVHQLDGGEADDGMHRVPATLVVRESCGCSEVSAIGSQRTPEVALPSATPTPGRARVEQLAVTAFTGPIDSLSMRYTDEETRAGWTRAVLEPLIVAAESGSAPSVVALRRLNNLTAALQPHPEALEQCISAVREVELELGSELTPGSKRLATLQRVTTDVLLTISRSCTRPLLARNGTLERVICDQYEVDMDLLSERGESPRSLTWLPQSVRGPACLGIWTGPEDPPGERALEIVGVRGRSSSLARLVGRHVPAGRFPPEALTCSAAISGTSLTFVVPVTSPTRDWGLLAVNGRVDSQMTRSRERYQHWAALLAIALDQEELVKELREHERSLTEVASLEHASAEEVREHEERLTLWTQALEHGTWDWDVSAGTVYYSPQWKRALGYGDDEIGSSPDEWLDRVHVDDRHDLAALIAAQLGGARAPLRLEHRVRDASGQFRWMMCRAITVLDDAGCPSRIVGALVDVTDHKERELTAERGVLRDPQTGLPNRLLFVDRLTEAIGRARGSSTFDCGLALLHLTPPRTPDDVDERDGTLGTPGTPGLDAAVEHLVDGLRVTDCAARLGPSEFAVLLGDVGPGGGADQLAALVTHLRSGPVEPVAIGTVESIRGFDDAEVLLRAAQTASAGRPA